VKRINLINCFCRRVFYYHLSFFDPLRRIRTNGHNDYSRVLEIALYNISPNMKLEQYDNAK